MTGRLEPVSWSEIKTYQRCPKQWEYKYDQRLVPKGKARPLYLGSWGHAALETHYENGDWKLGFNIYLDDYNKLFEEEREALETKRGRRGRPLPDIITQILKSYFWYHRDDGWKVVAVEQKFEVDTPLKIGGKIVPFDGIIDLIIEDREGRLWVVDHKFVSSIPEANSFHGMDPQLMLYPWAAGKAWKMDITGIIYNYVKSTPPTIPQVTKAGAISQRKINTDYPTLYRFLKSNGYDPGDFRDILLPLQKRSPFLRRYRLPRTAQVTKEVLLDLLAVAKRRTESTRRTRTITRECARQCSFHNLCRAELNGLDTSIMRKKYFTLKEEKVLGDYSETYFEDVYETEAD